MAPTSRAEAVVGTPEVHDGKNKPLPEGDDSGLPPALRARINAMPNFPQLGPPDVVYVRKRFRPVMGQAYNYGYYHFIRGADASSPAALSSYIYSLLNAGLDPAPWLASGSWEIVGATVHSYNALAKRDAVVDITLPGGISAFSVGADGVFDPASAPSFEAFWKETSVCAVARSMASVGEMPPYPCMRAIYPLPTPASENAFLTTAASCIKRWHLAGTDRPGVAKPTTANSRIAAAIANYFMSDARYARAQAFFDSDAVLVADPESGAYAARAANRAGKYADAARIISTVLELNVHASDAWLARAETLLLQDDIPAAIEAAHKATNCAPDDLTAWIQLAELYAISGDYESALVALNSADMPPPPLDPYLRELIPNRKFVTAPLKGGDQARSGAVRTLTQKLREERNTAGDRADEMLAELPGKLMNGTERTVYAVLVKIQTLVGWDELLSVRGRCFVMEADVEAASEARAAKRQASPHMGASSSDADVAGVELGAGAGATGIAGDRGDEGGDTEGDVVGDLSAVSLSDSKPESSKDEKLQVSVSKEEGVNGNGSTILHFEPKWAEKEKKGGEGEGSSASEGESEGELPIPAMDDIGKKVCKPWLDYLVTNLYEDLRAMAVWKAEEMLHRSPAATASTSKSSGEAAAAALREGAVSSETVADLEAGVSSEDTLSVSGPYVRSSDDIAETSRRPPVDWLRRGELGLRLQVQDMAKTAFLVCMKLTERTKQQNISSLINVMTMSAAEGNCRVTLRCADAVMTFVDSETEYQAKQKSLDAGSECPPVVRNAIHQLIAKVGLNSVRSSLPSRMDVDHSRLEGLLLDAVVWKVHNYDS